MVTSDKRSGRSGFEGLRARRATSGGKRWRPVYLGVLVLLLGSFAGVAALGGILPNRAAATTETIGTVLLKPSADIAATGVQGVKYGTVLSSSLYQLVDDGTAFSDADDSGTYVQTASGIPVASHTLAYSGVETGVVSEVVVHLRAKRSKFANGTVRIYLYDGTNLIGSGIAHSLRSSYSNFIDTFSNLNVANVNNLRTKVTFQNGSRRGNEMYTEIWLEARYVTPTAPTTTTPPTTPANNPPTVTVASPASGAAVSGVVSVGGNAGDDTGLSKVEVQVDGGPFQPATGTAAWSYRWDTTGLTGSHTLTARATDTSGLTSATALSVNVLASAPAGGSSDIGALLDRRDFIYGSEIGAWRTDGRPAVDPTTPVPALVKAAKIPVVRFAVYDVFTDMLDPLGNPGTQSRTRFDAALDGIRNNLNAEIVFKLLPNSRDTITTKPGTIYAPPKDKLTLNLGYSKEIIKQAGPRIRIYESSNELEYNAYKLWGFSSAGAVGVSTIIGQHYAQNMPALKKYARSLGFEIISIGYVGVSGGTGWGDSVVRPRTRTIVEFMTAVHDAYVASGYDPDYIPDAVSYHAYPYSGDFLVGTPLSEVIAYYDALTAAWRAEINAIWGPTIGPKIKLVCSEWNAGSWNSTYQWPGFQDQRVNDFYAAFLQMLRRNNYWMANQFALASNSTRPYDLINTDGTPARQYETFKAVSLADPVR